eukprot:scaffold22670_cov78-Skeletonema_dohrnii-CCMP3373.AAC.1
MNDKYKQKSIKSMFGPKAPMQTQQKKSSAVLDIEDFQGSSSGPGRPIVHSKKSRRRPRAIEAQQSDQSDL